MVQEWCCFLRLRQISRAFHYVALTPEPLREYILSVESGGPLLSLTQDALSSVSSSGCCGWRENMGPWWKGSGRTPKRGGHRAVSRDLELPPLGAWTEMVKQRLLAFPGKLVQRCLLLWHGHHFMAAVLVHRVKASRPSPDSYLRGIVDSGLGAHRWGLALPLTL